MCRFGQVCASLVSRSALKIASSSGVGSTGPCWQAHVEDRTPEDRNSMEGMLRRGCQRTAPVSKRLEGDKAPNQSARD